MRNLKKLLEKIYRKAALKLVKRGVEGPPPKAEAVDASPEQPADGASCVVFHRPCQPSSYIFSTRLNEMLTV